MEGGGEGRDEVMMVMDGWMTDWQGPGELVLHHIFVQSK
jgi:hypothetical protein